MIIPCHRLLTGAILLAYICPLHPARAAAGFSESRLKALGIDLATAAYFADVGRFSPGITEVDLRVNGKSRGIQKVNFGSSGELCADDAFFAAAAIRPPASLSGWAGESSRCPALADAWPTASQSLKPNTQEVHIVVPPEAVENESDLTHYEHDGVGGVLNYSAYRSWFESSGGRSENSNLNLETGFNAGSWMVRSVHNLQQSSTGGFAWQNAYVYAQKTLVERKQLLQAGQIGFSNGLLSGAPIDGVQLIPQTALTGWDSGVEVSGIAQADQSRVEVHQNGIMIYSTLVPVGPFTLTALPVLNTSSDLQVRIIAPDGREEVYTVIAASFRQLVPQAPETWSLALGHLRAANVQKDYDRPWVVSLSDGWGLSRKVLLEAGVIAASSYRSGGAGVIVNPHPALSVGVSGAVSQDRNHHQKGAKMTSSVDWLAPFNFSFGGDFTLYTPDYQELTGSVSKAEGSYGHTSTGFRGNWSHADLGSFSLSINQTRAGYDNGDTRSLMAGWSRNFSFMSASVNWQRQSQAWSDCGSVSPCRNRDRDNLFVNLSFAPGGQRISGYYRRSPDSAVAGLQTGNNLAENSSWSLAVEHDLKQEHNNSLSGNVNGNLHYTSAGIYGYAAGNDIRNYTGMLSGGVVAHKEGVIFSSQKINETFGVVAVEPVVSGVEISTPQGKVWTDWRGKAVVPGLPAFAPGRIELNTEQLPENIDVTNGYRQLVAGHGSVTDTHFTLQQTRNGLLSVTLADGSPLPKGCAITTQDGSYVTTAVDVGTVFLADLNDPRSLMARWQQHSCTLSYSVPEKPEKGVAYENVNAVCR